MQKSTKNNQPTNQSQLVLERAMARKLLTIRQEAIKLANQIKQAKQQLELQKNQFPLTLEKCKTVDFHFNKKSLEWPWLPFWVIKAKGQTYYVDQVTSHLPWSTRNQQANTHTKGVIRWKNASVSFDHKNTATVWLNT